MSVSPNETPVRFSAHGPRGVRELERLAEAAFADRLTAHEGEPAPARETPSPLASRATLSPDARPARSRAKPAREKKKISFAGFETPARALLAVGVLMALAGLSAMHGASLPSGDPAQTLAPFAAAEAWRNGTYSSLEAGVAGGLPVHVLLSGLAGGGAEPGAALAAARAGLAAMLAPLLALVLAPRLSLASAGAGALAAGSILVFAPLAAWPAGLALALALRAMAAPSREPGLPIIEGASAGLVTGLLALVSPLLAVLAVAVRLNAGPRMKGELLLPAIIEAFLAIVVFGAVFLATPGGSAPFAILGAPDPALLGTLGLIAAAAALAGVAAAEDRAVVSGGAAAGALAFAFGGGAVAASALWLAAAIAGLAPARRARRRSDYAGLLLSGGLAVACATALASPAFAPVGAFGFAGVSDTPAVQWVERGFLSLDEARRTGNFGDREEFAALARVLDRIEEVNDAGGLAALLAPDAFQNALAGLAPLEDPRYADFVIIPRFGPEAGPESAEALKEAVGGVLYVDFRHVEETPLFEVWERRARLK